MKNKIIIVSVTIVTVIALLIGLYFYGLTPVSKEAKTVEFTVDTGAKKTEIVDKLKEAGLIKSKISLYIYLGLNSKLNLQAGDYELSANMSAKEIIAKINAGKIIEIDNTFKLTFIEGKRITDYAKIIAGATNSTSEDVLKVLNDKEYLQELITKYWFLTDDILDSGIYYPLEGYLFPSTYELYNGSSIKDIVTKMLDGMSTRLTGLKNDIESSKYSIHELLTLASIIESEGANSDDRAGVAGVFYNRLNRGEALGSDVTAYYAAKKDFSTDLWQYEIDACSPYNTRGKCAVKGIPIGPISNPSFESINAAINPSSHDYLFFVADKNKKTYFTKTNGEHEAKIRELRAAGLWYEYN